MGERIQDPKGYTCSFVNCKATFNKSWKLEAHLCKHTGLKPFSCDHCDKSFCTRYQLTRHQLGHSGEKPYKCLAPGCTEAFVTHASMKNHMARIHQHQERRYKCAHKDCGKDFNKKNQLNIHMCEHTQLQPFHCNFEGCNKQFTASRKLKHHEKVHQGYPCAEDGCPFLGKTWTDYQKHRKAEHKVMLPCDGCKRWFPVAWFLQQHQLRVHTGEKKVFQCSKNGCKTTFTTRFNLENHVLDFHENKKAFSCTREGCGKSFAMEESLRRHGVVHDPAKKKLPTKSRPKKRRSSRKKRGMSKSGTESTQAQTIRLAARLRNTSLDDTIP